MPQGANSTSWCLPERPAVRASLWPWHWATRIGPRESERTMHAHRRFLIGVLLLGLLSNPAIAQEVIDMKGKTALITGSTSGLGENVAKRLGALGATVIIHGLNEERGKQIAAEITTKGPGRAVYYAGDLGSLKQVDALAERVKAAHPRLDLLINNAGIGGTSNGERRESVDGYELVFQVNYLSHFHLTRKLLPLLEKSAPARIVNVASIGQRALNFDDVMMKNGYQTMNAY